MSNEDPIKAIEDSYDQLTDPPDIEYPQDHSLWPKIKDALKEIYDPEIPVNIYELGLIYKVEVKDNKNGKLDVAVEMTLTSPGCPVAQEMPSWVQGAVFSVEDIENVDVELVWDPPWDPSKMAETARLSLNMM